MSKPETNLERRALLGDWQAQEECARQGIALPCPCCGEPMVKEAGWFYHPNVMCILGLKSFRITDTDLLSMWNRRPAPPIGQCKDCAYKQKAAVNGKGFSICPASGMEITGDDFCSYFEEAKNNEPKEAPND